MYKKWLVIEESENTSLIRLRSKETSKEELTTGSIFAGRYKIIEELGKGGMGKVYRVFDQKLNEEVALKLIKPDIAADKKTIERFKNELKLARKITHKNVGRMYEFLEDKNTNFITMEYISGQDLKSAMKTYKYLRIFHSLDDLDNVCVDLIPCPEELERKIQREDQEIDAIFELEQTCTD